MDSGRPHLKINGEGTKSDGKTPRRVRKTIPLCACYYTGCWGLFQDLSHREDLIEIYTIKEGPTSPNDSDAYNVRYFEHKEHLRKGDIVFYHTPGSPDDDTDQYYHVVIVC